MVLGLLEWGKNGAKKIKYIDITYSKKDAATLSNMLIEESLIRIHIGARFRINSIGIEGLNKELDIRMLHNAKIERC